MNGTVFDIQKFSTHDGEGIRTTVFFKGCNNRCVWCHNPESLNSKPQLRFFPQKCIGCGKCAEVCAHGVFSENGELKWDSCVACGKCAEVCCTGAREMSGKTMSAEDVVAEIMKDKLFYDNTGGGATFSGGEPMLQIDFLTECAKFCKEKGIDVCIQTASNVPYEYFEKVLPYTDTIMSDLKVFDEEVHKKYIGVSNKRILENLKKLSFEDVKLIVRTPIVTDVNDAELEIAEICNFISEFQNLEYYELLRYHNLGLSKLESLNMDFGREFEIPSDEKMEKLTAIAREVLPHVKSCIDE